MDLSQNNSFLVAGRDSGNISGTYGTKLVGHTSRARNVSISSNGKHEISRSDDMTTRIWETESSSQVGHIRHEDDPISKYSILFISDENCVMLRSPEGVLRVWNIAIGPEICEFFQVISNVRYT